MVCRALVVAIVVCGSGCGDNRQPAEVEQTCVRSTIDLLGGSVDHPGGARLVVPAGGVSSSTEISLCTVTAAPGAIGDEVVIGPSALQFARPARLTIPIASMYVDSHRVEIGLDTNGRSRQMLQSVVDQSAGSVVANVPGAGDFVPLETSGGIYIASSLAIAGARVGQSYQTTLTATGGVSPYAWSLLSGSTLPPGLMLGTNGDISGAPTIDGVFTTFVIVSDSANHSLAAGLTIEVDPVVPPTPQLDALSPAFTAQNSAPFAILGLGRGFVPLSMVTWDGTTIASTYLDSTHLAVMLDAGVLATAGAHQVTVTNPGGGTSNSVVFTVEAPNPNPVLTAVAPSTLPVSNVDFQITLTGSAFLMSSTVAVNGSPIPTQYMSSTQLTAEVPATYLGTTGTLQIAVTNPAPGGGTSGIVTVGVVSNNPVPTLSALSQTSAMLGAPGFTLHATGTGFTSSSVLYFGSSALATTVVNGTNLDAMVPTSLLTMMGTFPVTVSNPAPGGGSSNAISFAIGGGCGWSTSTSVSVGGNPRALAMGDFNGDGRVDLVDADFTSGTVSILAGNGADVFTVVSTPAAGTYPMSVAVADVNHDGKQDVLTGNYCNLTPPCSAEVLLGNGDGTFQPATRIAIGSGPNNPGELVVADFNRDGNPDLAVGNNSDVSVLLGDGTGGFTADVTLQGRPGGYVVRGVASADFNEDGKPDLVVTDQGISGMGIMGAAAVFVGDGSGGFAPALLLTAGAGSFAVQTGDFDGDGHIDVAMTNNFDATVSIFRGDGAGGFGSAITTPVAGATAGNLFDVAVADFNGDGHLDLAALNGDRSPNGFAVLMIGRGDGTFWSAATVDVGDAPLAVIAGDFDADGAPDLAAANQVANSVTIAPSTCP